MSKDIPVVILCGGRGTRLQEETELRPKPLVEIGGKPILWHIMKHYSAYGFKRFILCLGYKKEMIKDYFLNYHYRNSDLTLRLADSTPKGVTIHRKSSQVEDWEVTLADTGDEAMTGARIYRIQPYLKSDTFMLTYGDGVSNVDLDKLVKLHKKEGRIATLTAVRAPGRFGEITLNGHATARFEEKPAGTQNRINGGFFVADKKIFKYLNDNDGCIFEREPLERLSKENQLAAYPHDGFWQCMDTLRDVENLRELWNSGKAKWKTWD